MEYGIEQDLLANSYYKSIDTHFNGAYPSYTESMRR